VTSETLRAVQTAEIVAKALSIPVVRTSLLDDPPAGIFEGAPVEAFADWMNAWDADTPVPGTTVTPRDSARRYFDAVGWCSNDRKVAFSSLHTLQPYAGSSRPHRSETTH
jgi:broad specificity phosphatase PhoE